MRDLEKTVRSWRGEYLTVHILYSTAGIAQDIRISNEKGFILVDAGDGVLRDLVARRRNINEIKGIFFTHGHFDHVGGLYSILGFLRMIGRVDRLHVFAPEGCTEVFSIVDGFTNSYSTTISYEVLCTSVRPQEVVQVAGMSIEAYPVLHCGSTKDSGILAPVPAMGYRISYKDEKVAISGDTGNCPSLKELVGGADLAILEATYRNRKDVGEEYLQKVHLSRDLATKLGETAEEFILVHKGRRKE